MLGLSQLITLSKVELKLSRRDHMPFIPGISTDAASLIATPNIISKVMCNIRILNDAKKWLGRCEKMEETDGKLCEGMG
jgi:hypothetical protein